MLRLWTVDAFTTKPFAGNPAAVCLMKKYDEKLCQTIAAEMNLSETAFLVPINGKTAMTNKYFLRWWTPTTEVKFCGHATLASVHILYEEGFADNSKPIEFETKDSGTFIATKPNPSKCEYLMNFPALMNKKYDGNKRIISNILNVHQNEIKQIVEAGEDLLIEMKNAQLIKECNPSFSEIEAKLGMFRCILITAKSCDNFYDFESRVFCPTCGVNEDPVTGSAHSALGVYWSQKLMKNGEWMNAYQCSKRGGNLRVKYDESKKRILIIGNAVTVSQISMKIKSKM